MHSRRGAAFVRSLVALTFCFSGSMSVAHAGLVIQLYVTEVSQSGFSPQTGSVLKNNNPFEMINGEAGTAMTSGQNTASGPVFTQTTTVYNQLSDSASAVADSVLQFKIDKPTHFILTHTANVATDVGANGLSYGTVLLYGLESSLPEQFFLPLGTTNKVPNYGGTMTWEFVLDPRYTYFYGVTSVLTSDLANGGVATTSGVDSSLTAVPEPASLFLFAFGAAACLVARSRRAPAAC